MHGLPPENWRQGVHTAFLFVGESCSCCGVCVAVGTRRMDVSSKSAPADAGRLWPSTPRNMPGLSKGLRQEQAVDAAWRGGARLGKRSGQPQGRPTPCAGTPIEACAKQAEGNCSAFTQTLTRLTTLCDCFEHNKIWEGGMGLLASTPDPGLGAHLHNTR